MKIIVVMLPVSLLDGLLTVSRFSLALTPSSIFRLALIYIQSYVKIITPLASLEFFLLFPAVFPHTPLPDLQFLTNNKVCTRNSAQSLQIMYLTYLPTCSFSNLIRAAMFISSFLQHEGCLWYVCMAELLYYEFEVNSRHPTKIIKDIKF